MWNIRTPHTTHQARGLTLVEMLMATALTLIMFAAVAQIFGMMGNAMRDARATIELSGNLRSVSNQLQNNLNNVTADVLPWAQPGSNQGYFEIVEGPDRDVDFAAWDVIGDDETITTDPHNGSMAGDADDILSFTAYSKDEPFVGLIYGQLMPMPAGSQYQFYIDQTASPVDFTVITSHYAEIVYFTKRTAADDRNLEEWSDSDIRNANETVTLYRRVFLIRPDIKLGPSGSSNSYSYRPEEVHNYFDLSVYSPSGMTNWETNSLEDLQDRVRRMAHYPVPGATDPAFPTRLDPARLLSFEQLHEEIEANVGPGTNERDRTGEDVIMTNVMAFDVRVYDPLAVIREESASSGTIAVQPGDFYYPGLSAADPVFADYDSDESMLGAFVDLNWTAQGRATDPTARSFFAGAPNAKSDLSGITAAPYTQSPSMLMPPGETVVNPNLTYAFYDTWPLKYESDGDDQDNDGVTDEGTNGFDDNGNNVVDDLVEYETSPPYPFPLRGISVTIRAIEDGTRQVRQNTIMADFLPD
ncbi:type II secretion system protein J [Blastopirellula marina]|uniref:Uncharacterized protein n=1 Tax=Blastopirellula marina TaxID=124 RepID=A0A2S8GUN4_9BACT|nr:hypothetical protein [Blastopirellula marina]PQO47764.1 hypothetical protein C5Y93_01595 [Blastopirellula marina]